MEQETKHNEKQITRKQKIDLAFFSILTIFSLFIIEPNCQNKILLLPNVIVLL